MSMEITVRKMQRADAEILSRIQTEAFRPLYERYHDEGNPCLRGMEDILRRLENPVNHPFTILCDGEIVGGLWYRSRGNGFYFDELKPGEYYLQRVFITPELQGRHIARRAILFSEKQLPGAAKSYVDFPADLDKNRLCYEGAGYRDSGIRQEVVPGLILAGYIKQTIQQEEIKETE